MNVLRKVRVVCGLVAIASALIALIGGAGFWALSSACWALLFVLEAATQ